MEDKVRDLRSGIVTVIFSLFMYFWMIPRQVKVREGIVRGPDFLPKLLIGLIGICGVIMVVRGIVFLKKQGELSVKAIAGEHLAIGLKRFFPQIIFLGVSIVYLLVMPYIGFITASIPLLVFLLLFFGNTHVLRSVIMAIVYIAVVFLIFTYVFRIKFPMGPLGF